MTNAALVMCCSLCMQWVVRNVLGPQDELHLVSVALPIPYPVRVALAQANLPLKAHASADVNTHTARRSGGLRCVLALALGRL